MGNEAKRNLAQTNAQDLEAEMPLPADVVEMEEIEVQMEGVSDRDTGLGETLRGETIRTTSGEDTRGGDVDTNRYQAKVSGEEAVGGLTPTPGQNITQNLQAAAGIDTAQNEPVQTTEKLSRRDEQRWQLDPMSSEDYEERREE